MKLGFFVSLKPPPPPKGADPELWRAAYRHAPYAYDGPTEGEPGILRMLAVLRAEMTRAHHEDRPLAEAHRTRDQAALVYRSAEDETARVDAEAAPIIEAGRAARRRRKDPDARHLRSEGARATHQSNQAHDLRDGTRRTAEGQALGFQAASGAVTDRLHVTATAAVARMYEYLGLLNDRRRDIGLRPLPPLPPDLADQLVLETNRRVGEPARP